MLGAGMGGGMLGEMPSGMSGGGMLGAGMGGGMPSGMPGGMSGGGMSGGGMGGGMPGGMSGGMGGGQPAIGHVDDAQKEGVGLQLRNFRGSGWLEDDGIYEVLVETSIETEEGRETLLSNIMTVDMNLAPPEPPLTAVPDPGEGDGGGSDDGSFGGNRGGGSRWTQESVTSQSLTPKQLQLLASADSGQAVLILDGVKIILNGATLKTWAGRRDEIQVSGVRQGAFNATFQVKVMENGRSVWNLESAACLRIPLKKEDLLLSGLTAGQAETLIAVKKDGKMLASAYYDSRAEEVIARTTIPGTFEVVRTAPRQLGAMGRHWAAGAVEFALARGLVSGGDGNLKPAQEIGGKELLDILSKALPEGAFNAKAKALINKNQGVTRLEAARLLYEISGRAAKEQRAAGGGDQKAAQDGEAQAFADVGGLSPQQRSWLAFVREKGWMTGSGGGLFLPAKKLTRAEAVALAVNLVKSQAFL